MLTLYVPREVTVSACQVGQQLAPGQSCAVSEGVNFEVRNDGLACLGGSICAGTGITVNNFSASRIEGTNNWRINSL